MAQIERWWERRALRVALALALLIAGGGGWNVLQTRPDGRLHLIFPALDGDALLLITPSGRAIVIDGSADAVGMAELAGERLPFWQRAIDALVLTRADGERLPGALALARRYQIGQALAPEIAASPQAEALRQELARQGARIQPGVAGAAIAIDGVTIQVLRPAAAEAGMALLVAFGGWSALLAPAPDDSLADELARTAPPAALLWWPWARADDRLLSERIGAGAVVYGQAEGGRHTPRSIYERGGAERQLLHERLHGTIEVATDGYQMWVLPEFHPAEGHHAPQSRPRAFQRDQQRLRGAAQADHLRQRPQRGRPLHAA